MALVFVTITGLLFWLSDNPFVQSILAIPAAGAVMAGLFEVLRDRWAHDRSVALTDLQNRYSLGATSHMAIVTFDKFVEFAEAYTSELQETLLSIFRDGPTSKAIGHAADLFRLRQDYVLWLTRELQDDLAKYEQALRIMGADAHLLEYAQQQQNRHAVVARMYKRYAKLLGPEIMGDSAWEGEQLEESEALSMIFERLRMVLGTEKLTTMRSQLVDRAVSLSS
jgi:hypothetical protein